MFFSVNFFFFPFIFSLFSFPVSGSSVLMVPIPAPYNQPTCLTPEFLAGLPSPIFPPSPSTRPTLFLERDGWPGHYLTNAIAAHILMDVLGYTINIIDINSSQGVLKSTAARVGEGIVDFNLEVWPNAQNQWDYKVYVEGNSALDQTQQQQLQQQQQRQQQPITNKQQRATNQQSFSHFGLVLFFFVLFVFFVRSASNAGPLGVIGRSGWYIPTYDLNWWTFDYVDFWRSYQTLSTTSKFLHSGFTPYSLKVGKGVEFVPPYCVRETSPYGCDPSDSNEAYLNGSCIVVRYNPDCIELISIDTSYDPGVVQQQIINLHLNITVPFVGDANFPVLIQEKINNAESFLFFDWSPSVEVAQGTVSRITLPDDTDDCWSNNTQNLDGLGGVNCDFPPQALLKLYTTSLASNWRYKDAIYFVEHYSYETHYQMSLLAGMNLPQPQWESFAAQATCDWLLEYPSIWRSWIEITPAEYTKSLPSAAVAVVGVSVVIVGLITIFLHIFLYRNQSHPLIRSSSYRFNQIIVSGSWFAMATIILLPYKSISYVCTLLPFFLSIGFVVVFGSLFAKTWRLNKIFHGASLKKVRVSELDVAAFVGFFLIWEIAIEIVWNALDRPTPTLTNDATDPYGQIYVCSTNNPTLWYSLLLLPKAILLIYGSFLAYTVRHIAANFNESKYIALSIYNCILLGLVLIPLTIALNTQLVTSYLIDSLGIALCLGMTLALLFGPKVYTICYSELSKKLRKEKEKVTAAVDPLHHQSKDSKGMIMMAGDLSAGEIVLMREAQLRAGEEESICLSFPSIGLAGGFAAAVKQVRILAQNLYNEYGLLEYWQFCTAMQALAAQEIQARAPLLAYTIAQIQQQQQQEQQQREQREQHTELSINPIDIELQPMQPHLHDITNTKTLEQEKQEISLSQQKERESQQQDGAEEEVGGANLGALFVDIEGLFTSSAQPRADSSSPQTASNSTSLEHRSVRPSSRFKENISSVSSHSARLATVDGNDRHSSTPPNPAISFVTQLYQRTPRHSTSSLNETSHPITQTSFSHSYLAPTAPSHQTENINSSNFISTAPLPHHHHHLSMTLPPLPDSAWKIDSNQIQINPTMQISYQTQPKTLTPINNIIANLENTNATKENNFTGAINNNTTSSTANTLHNPNKAGNTKNKILTITNSSTQQANTDSNTNSNNNSNSNSFDEPHNHPISSSLSFPNQSINFNQSFTQSHSPIITPQLQLQHKRQHQLDQLDQLAPTPTPPPPPAGDHLDSSLDQLTLSPLPLSSPSSHSSTDSPFSSPSEPIWSQHSGSDIQHSRQSTEEGYSDNH